MKSPRAFVWFVGACVATIATVAMAANWPHYRGPTSDGAADDTGLPVTWSAEENVVWKTELPGRGASCPVTWGGSVFLTCYSGYGQSAEQPGDQENLQLHVVCIDRDTGNTEWKYDVKAALPEEKFEGFVTEHGYASGTPAADGMSLFVYLGKSGLYSLSMEGELKWRADVGDKTHKFGSSASPVLYGDLVIVNAQVECGALVAFHESTGKEAWRVEGINRSWGNPVLVRAGDRDELVIIQEGPILALDPQTGKELWRCAGPSDYTCADVIAREGVVFAMGGGRNRQAMAIRAGGSGDVTQTHVLWKINKASNIGSPVYHDGHLYFVHDSQGIVYCVDAKSGEIKYEQRLEPRSGKIYASPVVADGKIYVVSRTNGMYVIAPKPQFELLAHNKLSPDDSVFNAAPAVSNGQLLLRSDRYLYCLGKK